ncbi:hypothetical protein HU200_039739 [Digitaria exilis]|uniref:DUF6598 domain-containing protein n=1 Tax=Digitaria exilis TaxID=1010633 RepID=A0A835EF33_9POAL|nr:hypothetical protein HU200_039739 [Digitaria exilis]CAB3466484.1 unnamed protein product [Digitaria exilis]
MELGGGATEHPRKRKAAAAEEVEDDGHEEGLISVEVVEGSKHSDGYIFRLDVHPLHEMYRLNDTRETRLGPMRVSDPTDICHPCWTACRQHVGCSMMQIFSLKLSNLPRGAATGHGPIQLYGFMAVRDLLDPLRNYVFNRSRDNPFTIQDLHSDPFIYLSGPTRGIYLQRPVLIEYDLRIKQEGGRKHDDLQLIDGAATFSELTFIQGATTNRIDGDGGARVDIARALLPQSVEATVEVWMSKLGCHSSDLELIITGFVGRIPEEIKVFRGTIGGLRDPKKFVVAVRLRSALFLYFKAPGLGADPICKFAFRAVAHGGTSEFCDLDSLSVDVKVTWSNLY